MTLRRPNLINHNFMAYHIGFIGWTFEMTKQLCLTKTLKWNYRITEAAIWCYLHSIALCFCIILLLHLKSSQSLFSHCIWNAFCPLFKKAQCCFMSDALCAFDQNVKLISKVITKHCPPLVVDKRDANKSKLDPETRAFDSKKMIKYESCFLRTIDIDMSRHNLDYILCM